jgi:hypothetical protein
VIVGFTARDGAEALYQYTLDYEAQGDLESLLFFTFNRGSAKSKDRITRLLKMTTGFRRCHDGSDTPPLAAESFILIGPLVLLRLKNNETEQSVLITLPDK